MFEYIDLNGIRTDVTSDLISGLTATPKRIPAYFIYDKRGSELFTRICELPEYYLTRTELAILEKFAEDMVQPFAPESMFVELGSGNLFKTDLLLRAFLKYCQRFRFVPVDISKEILKESALRVHKYFPSIDVTACCGEYCDSLDYLRQSGQRKLIAWLGSSIGNFSEPDAVAFLRRLRTTMQARDGLLIGIDLKKNAKVVERAYNDAAGVTSDFHLNVLHRFNREFGADFKVDNFYHRSFYDSDSGAVEAYIISRCEQKVRLPDLGLEVHFGQGEKVFNELSHKYDLAGIEALATQAQFALHAWWLDDNADFAMVLLGA
jgi:L-histidine Nalpha-methyltransferase